MYNPLIINLNLKVQKGRAVTVPAASLTRADRSNELWDAYDIWFEYQT
jgi:hypothetical protein